MKPLVLGCIPNAQKKNLIFSLWQNTTVFQAEIYNIKAGATETIEAIKRNYTHKM
jgi:hypothetical protein